jgi:HEAT repeat protein
LLALEVHALDDPNPTIRMVAADGLAKTGDPLVLPLLRKKMESETDEIVKSDMSRDIEALARAIPK